MQLTLNLVLVLASAVAATPGPIGARDGPPSGPPVLFSGNGTMSIVNMTTGAIIGCLDPFGDLVTTDNCGIFSTVGNTLFFLASGTDDTCGINNDTQPPSLICDGSTGPAQWSGNNGVVETTDVFSWWVSFIPEPNNSTAAILFTKKGEQASINVDMVYNGPSFTLS